MTRLPKDVNRYRYLAKYYDQVFGFAASWSEPARRAIVEPLLPEVASACDLCCGTGTTAVALARRGIRTFAVDLSPGMCRAAREKAVEVRVLRSDMRTFRLPGRVDLVTCEFDALNHVPEEEDLAAVARSVARALRPGGHFYFDLNNSPAFRRLWPGTWFVDTPGVAMVMHGGYDRERDRAWSAVEWFICEGSLWRRRTEKVREVCWTAAEVRTTLREAGFDRIRAWDAERFFRRTDPAIRPGFRTFYLARKC